MSLTTGKQLLLSSAAGTAAGYQISRSLRFNSSDSAYLSKNFGSAGNRKTWTWAGWVKRSTFNNGGLFGKYYADNTFGTLFFSSDSLQFSCNTTWFTTTQVLRDPSAWYHIVLAVDTTNATAGDRIRLYVNGSEVTSFATENNPSPSANLGPDNTTDIHIGRDGANYFNGYLADVHFVDGQQLTPSSFTETDANGVLQPKAYTGSYGTNGFKLSFSDNASAAALGTDTSGNGNTWTVNNLSVTAGAGNDSLVDSPTNYGTDDGLGASVRGNYATLNPLISSATLTNGNLQVTGSVGAYSTIQITSGTWYVEYTCLTAAATNWAYCGITWDDITSSANWRLYRSSNGDYFNGSSYSSYGSSWTAGDVIGVAVDITNSTLTFYKNGVSQGQKTGLSLTGKTVAFICLATGGGAGELAVNFGQRPFAYTAPSGFKALCTQNLPQPTGVVAQPSTAFDVKLYTGNGSTQTISGLGFSPDFVWIKDRSQANGHGLFDAIRGATKGLFSNLTNAEVTDSNSLTSFDATGFSTGSGGTTFSTNINGNSYVGWCFDAGSSTVTNTQGSITSSVRANASAGFSIVTWTGTASAGTVGHGLGAAPEFIIVKNRSVSDSWYCYHKSLGNAARIQLNETSAQTTGSNQWNSTSPTSTVYSVGAGSWQASGNLIVSYCFAPVAGYSSFGSYTGNGSSDGPFVYTGFRPKWLMVKRTDASENWLVDNSGSSPYNVISNWLHPNLSNAEGSGVAHMDFLSNGFKHRFNAADTNTSGGNYIYAAFAESPFAYARAR